MGVGIVAGLARERRGALKEQADKLRDPLEEHPDERLVEIPRQDDLKRMRSFVGPFVHTCLCTVVTATDKPLLCNDDGSGVGLIDATVTQDDEGVYLVYKVDGNDIGIPSVIKAAELQLEAGSEGRLRVVVSHVPEHSDLLTNDLKWEGGCVEGPWFVKTYDYTYLFYSGSM